LAGASSAGWEEALTSHHSNPVVRKCSITASNVQVLLDLTFQEITRPKGGSIQGIPQLAKYPGVLNGDDVAGSDWSNKPNRWENCVLVAAWQSMERIKEDQCDVLQVFLRCEYARKPFR